MAKKKGRTLTIVVGCLALLALLTCFACCGGIAAVVLVGPGILVGLVVSDEPLPVQTVEWDEARVEQLEQRLAEQLATDRTLRLTGEEMTQLVISGDEDELVAFRIEVDAQDRAVLDLSLQLDPAQPQYVNFHAVGDFTIEDGWFTQCQFEELDVGKFDVGKYVAGQELEDDVNQSLAQQRASDPQVAEMFDMVEYLGIDDGALVLTLTEEGVQKLQTEGKL